MFCDESFNKMFGVQREDYAIEDIQRIDELNNRISSRQFSDKPLRPTFQPHGVVASRKAIFPLLDHRRQPTVAIQPVDTHHPSSNFNPGTAAYPFSSYLANFEDDVSLRRPMIRKQCQDVYIPHSSSDLYHVSLPQNVSRTETQTHPLLFERPVIHASTMNRTVQEKVGIHQLMNPTRTQLRAS